MAAEGKQTANGGEVSIQFRSSVLEPVDTAEESLRSPKDKARRQKIFEQCFSSTSSLPEKRGSTVIIPAAVGMYSSFQDTLEAFSNDDAFDYKNLSSREQTTLFNFPQKPIEQEALRQEEVAIERRSNRKRRETLSAAANVAPSDNLNLEPDKIEQSDYDDINNDLARKQPPFFQRVNVGEQSSAGGVSKNI